MKHEEQINELFKASQNGDIVKIKTLLTSLPDLANTENSDGLTPLGSAAHYGQAEAVRILLAQGADVNAVSHSKISFIPSNTALHAALAGERSVEVVRLLLEHGAATNILDSDGQNALHTAAFHTDQAELIELLLQHGADPSALSNSGQTALDIALERENHLAAQCLRDALEAKS
ncbi:ankyrin repeat protein [Paenibacillus amylolyticus]|uniref:Ankyrin repeat protein n=1 Tax=Paenibacillus amylolyticus TaxID=1451 RepID=A0AAP5H3B9_PAEAM|nr:ankyrin repeat domain-containing protein [Paenibacillus amylolyticus]MDR6724211.1 ankyrin repeat protein [Paenibacillus amylolyticus]